MQTMVWALFGDFLELFKKSIIVYFYFFSHLDLSRKDFLILCLIFTRHLTLHCQVISKPISVQKP